MTAPIFGIVNYRPEDEAIPVLGSDFSKVGLVSTSEDADDTLFPLNTAVRFSTNDATYLTGLGTGLLADAVRGINAQLSELQVAVDCIVVRVAEGTNVDPDLKRAETTANIVGNQGAKTGLYALLAAPEDLGATPRLIACPGYTDWQEDADTANPICAELPTILNALLAVAVVDGPGDSVANFTTWRETIQSDRMIPVVGGVKVLENAVTVVRPFAPRVLGLFVRIDQEHEGKPFHPIANRPIWGIVGPERKIAFSLTDGATEGQLFLAADGGVLVRAELGVDTSVADGGFVYIGTESCAEGDLWAQYHQVRGADYLTVKMMRITRQFLGKLVTADLVEAWITSIKYMLRDHKASNDILGYKVDFKKDLNSPEEVRLGHLTVTPRIEPGPAFRKATHEIRRYRDAVDAMVADIVSRIAATNAASPL